MKITVITCLSAKWNMNINTRQRFVILLIKTLIGAYQNED